ncbi:MAG: TonB-dependent receptor [Candidatus Kapaibacterium sp.]
MMRRFILILLVAMMALPSVSYASIYGILKGKVVDGEGKPVMGATVMLEGTTRGTNVRNPDGSFTIVNINSGTYTVIFRAVGKGEVRKKVRINADDVTEVNVTLEELGVTTEVIEITGDKMVDKNDIGSKQTFNSDDISNAATEGIASIVSQSAGVQSTGNGWNIRGSRDSDTQIRVDGLNISNQFTGGFGASGGTYYPMVSPFATEEVQVLSGSFSAEYGDAMGGIVNTVVKQGRIDRYEGFMRWRTDMPALFGSQGSGIDLIRRGDELEIFERGEGAKWQGSQEHNIEFGIGGPIPILNNSTFYLSGLYFNEKYRGNSYDIYDPIGNNLGQLENEGSWKKNITGRMKFAVTKNISLILGSMYGLSNFENASWTWLYADQEGILNGSSNGIPENVAKQNVINQFVTNYYARINHTLTDKAFYELTLSYNQNDEEAGRRVGWEDPGFFSGFEIMEPTDDYSVRGSTLVPGNDNIVDIYTPVYAPSTTDDGYLQLELPVRNPLTGYYEGNIDRTTNNNPYGYNQLFVSHGGSGFEFRSHSYWKVDGSLTSVLEHGDFSHTLKSGFDIQFQEAHRHYNGNPFDGNPFFDLYTDRSGGNIYADNEEVYQKTSKPYKPIKFGFFVQDQISYKGIVFNPGLRFDLFDPNAQYRLESNANFVSITADSGFGEASIKYQVSPRLSVTYPVTDRSKISIGYGLYFQMPQLQHLYDKFAVDVLRSGDILGNPNMDAQRTNSYEVSYAHQLTDDFMFDLTAYYKDVYNLLGVQQIPAVPDPYFQYTVAEYGNSRGLEFTLRKRPTNHFGFQVNYTLARATGTSTSPTTNFNVLTDPFTNARMFPLAEYTLGFDRTHTLNTVFNLAWNNDQGPAIGGIHLLENTIISFTGIYQTGLPYTATDRAGTPLGEINGERQPDYWTVNLRFSRRFPLNDYFGEGVGNTTLEFFFDVFNLLNRTAARSVYSATGDPLDDGITLERKIGDFSAVTWYRDVDYGNAETFQSTQYDNYGNRLYNANADSDNNGVVTQQEKYDAYFRYVEDALAFKGRFQIPRTVYLGFMIRF